MSVAAASAIATVTADEIFVKSALGGAAWLVASFNKNINLTTTGAGGMDTGAAPVSGFVAVYAIYNPATSTSALLAANATSAVQPEIYGGANMPAGYLASALVTVWPTNASGQFVVAYQVDRQISFPFAVVATTGVGVGSPTAISVANLVPRNARSCSGWATVITNGSSYASLNVSASSTLIGIQQIAGASNGGPGTNSGSFAMVPIIAAQTIYWSTTTTGGTFTSASIYLSGYAI
ncbi:phage tail protein [Pseudomonas baetica]|nr:phage tail protein [Pseudomonas baetica]